MYITMTSARHRATVEAGGERARDVAWLPTGEQLTVEKYRAVIHSLDGEPTTMTRGRLLQGGVVHDRIPAAANVVRLHSGWAGVFVTTWEGGRDGGWWKPRDGDWERLRFPTHNGDRVCVADRLYCDGHVWQERQWVPCVPVTENIVGDDALVIDNAGGRESCGSWTNCTFVLRHGTRLPVAMPETAGWTRHHPDWPVSFLRRDDRFVTGHQSGTLKFWQGLRLVATLCPTERDFEGGEDDRGYWKTAGASALHADDSRFSLFTNGHVLTFPPDVLELLLDGQVGIASDRLEDAGFAIKKRWAVL